MDIIYGKPAVQAGSWDNRAKRPAIIVESPKWVEATQAEADRANERLRTEREGWAKWRAKMARAAALRARGIVEIKAKKIKRVPQTMGPAF